MKQEKMIEMLAESLNNIAEALDNNFAGIPGGVTNSIKDAGHSINEPIGEIASNVYYASNALNRIADAIDNLAYVGERFLDEKTED